MYKHKLGSNQVLKLGERAHKKRRRDTYQTILNTIYIYILCLK